MSTVCNRIGNKNKMANIISPYFPPHQIYIELFFGAGGMFFNKPRAKYNFLNDIDLNIYNLFFVLMHHKQELIEGLRHVFLSDQIMKYFKHHPPDEPISKAVAFLYRSNFSYLGEGNTLKIGIYRHKDFLLKKIEAFQDTMSNCVFLEKDFREALDTVRWRHETRVPLWDLCFVALDTVMWRHHKDKYRTFLYCDPPYLTGDTHYHSKWSEADFKDLITICIASGMKFAISEFNNNFVVETAISEGLKIITLTDRTTLKNRNTEILLTNYETNNLFCIY